MSVINYTRQGDGPPVILIHGIAASLHDWNEIAPELAARGYSTFAPDLPGHGDSFKPDEREEYHVEAIYNHLERWIEGLDLGEPPLLVGHSLGGYLSLLYSMRHPDGVRGQVLINPFYTPRQLSPVLKLVGRRPTVGEQTLQAVPRWLLYFLTGFDPITRANLTPQARLQIAIDYKRASPKLIYITSGIPDLTPHLGEVATPTLVIWGQSDRTLNPASFPRLVQSLPAATSHPVPATGHQPHIERRHVVSRDVLEFATRLQPVEAI